MVGVARAYNNSLHVSAVHGHCENINTHFSTYGIERAKEEVGVFGEEKIITCTATNFPDFFFLGIKKKKEADRGKKKMTTAKGQTYIPSRKKTFS